MEQARNRHYSILSLDGDRAFEEASRVFERRVRHRLGDKGTIGWHDENLMLHLIVTASRPCRAPAEGP